MNRALYTRERGECFATTILPKENVVRRMITFFSFFRMRQIINGKAENDLSLNCSSAFEYYVGMFSFPLCSFSNLRQR